MLLRSSLLVPGQKRDAPWALKMALFVCHPKLHETERSRLCAFMDIRTPRSASVK